MRGEKDEVEERGTVEREPFTAEDTEEHRAKIGKL